MAMHAKLKQAYSSEIIAAQKFMQEGDLESAFARLEIAHILGQNHVLPHVQSHWLMLIVAARRQSIADMAGQAIRIIAGAIGSSIGIVPTGNTGGSNVSMFKRMPVPHDLAELLAK